MFFFQHWVMVWFSRIEWVRLIIVLSSGGMGVGLISVVYCMFFNFNFSAPTLIHGARISGLEARMDQVEDRICDLDARGSEEADNLANDRDLDRFILTGNLV